MNDKQLDQDLMKYGDKRNVVDKYKNWTGESIKADLTDNAFPLHIAIENIQHDINIGSIVRSANAFNVAGVHIIGKRHWNRRGAMATEKYLELYHHPKVEDFVSWVEKNNKKVIGIDNVGNTKNLSEYIFPKDIVLVFGQEGPGLSPEMQRHCQDIVAIEQFGSTRSVNVGVAAGIVMYAWIQQNKMT